MSFEFFVHPTSIVDSNVSIGAGTKVWHFCHLMGGSQIGNNCVLGQNVFIGKNVSLGNKVKVQNNVSVFEGVNCEDEVFIGPSVVFTNIINPRSGIDRKKEFKSTLVKKGATIGANATILCGITIGKYAFVGAGAVITKNIKDYALVIGNPGKQTGWMSERGYKLEFKNNLAICPESNKTYIIENGRVYKKTEK